MTPSAPLRVLAAPDKFRGTLTGPEAAAAIERGAGAAGAAAGRPVTCVLVPLADGGEGTVDALGGTNRYTTVTGPLGEPVDAGWRLDGDLAVIEMASASGLLLARGANDPMRATTRGTGELIAAAIDAGATRILIGLGGSATTDGGAGALEVLAPEGVSIVPDEVELIVAADVRTRFEDAATVFGPQKGADPDQVRLLTERLTALRAQYLRSFGIDIGEWERSGAAGGLAGGLAVLGARLVDGFTAVADAVELDRRMGEADLVITGEGRFDATSLSGKVVGGVIDRAQALGVPVAVVCGDADDAAPASVPVYSMTHTYGRDRAMADTAACVAASVEILVREHMTP